MIHAGDMIENAVTGERLRFHRTSAETNGELVVVETFVQAGGQVAAAHVHPHQQERFVVVEGAVGFKRGREKLVAGPGDGSSSSPVRRTSSGTPATRMLASSARSVPLSSSSA